MTVVVCLSDAVDLRAELGEAFRAHAPELDLLGPDQVADPAEVQVAFAFRPGPEAFDPFPRLGLLCSWGAGVDALISHPRLPDRAVVARMVDPGQAQMMAGFAVHQVTGWHRRLFDYPAQQTSRIWRELDWTPNAEVPVGLLGYGNMGRAVARGLTALGYPVQAWAGRARQEDGVTVTAGAAALDALLADCRAVINVLPLTPATEGLLNRDTLGKMRPDAILIHIGRGAQLVEADLIPALDAGRPGCAALDVFAREPLPEAHPFWSHPNVRVTPHVASVASNQAVARSVARAVAAWKAGDPPEGFVDRARGY